MAFLSHKMYVPKTKYELLNSLVQMYPNDTGKFNRMKKKQLFAIYFSKRKANKINLGGY